MDQAIQIVQRQIKIVEEKYQRILVQLGEIVTIKTKTEGVLEFLKGQLEALQRTTMPRDPQGQDRLMETNGPESKS